MKLSKHFSRHEFACSDGCGFDTVDVATLEILEAIRTHFNAPLEVTSGARCVEYNASIGGAENSQHTYGRAADIQVSNVSPKDVYDWVALNFPFVSLGSYTTFTHVDTRTNGPARW
jgi:uncharacterized protein YcbK (DUF882 family)